jgi:hypothetical protein
LKNLLKRGIARLLATAPMGEFTAGIAGTQEVQTVLKVMYHQMRDLPSSRLPKFSEVGFRKYSQFEEDGILLYVFSLVGTTNKKVVELCAGNGRECMAANLIINHGWQGYLFDGNAKNVAEGRALFRGHKDLLIGMPAYSQAWLTAENINDVLGESGAHGSVDLLSLDIDGMDYWVWNAIDCIQPRVCIFETVNYIPSDLALTAKYRADFSIGGATGLKSYYRGASTLAMAKLSKKKGYRLVGSHRHGFNCIFMKSGVGEAHFPEVSVQECHADPASREGQTKLWPQLIDFDWQAV